MYYNKEEVMSFFIKDYYGMYNIAKCSELINLPIFYINEYLKKNPRDRDCFLSNDDYMLKEVKDFISNSVVNYSFDYLFDKFCLNNQSYNENRFYRLLDKNKLIKKIVLSKDNQKHAIKGIKELKQKICNINLGHETDLLLIRDLELNSYRKDYLCKIYGFDRFKTMLAYYKKIGGTKYFSINSQLKKLGSKIIID
jgi:hypothetical protein